MDLMYCSPSADPTTGEIEPTPNGGMRRIDRLIYDTSLGVTADGAAFVSALAGQTDHVPFALTLKSD